MSISSPEASPESLSILPAHTMDFAGRQTLGFYFTHLAHHEETLLAAWDVEALHDMRVASRRLRVALKLFRPIFGRKALWSFGEQLRFLGGLLGAVRDLDVFIEFVDEYGRNHGLSSGGEAIRGQLMAERAAPRKALEEYLGQVSHRRFKAAFFDWLYGDGAQACPPRKAGLNPVRGMAPVFLEEGRTGALSFGPLLAGAPSSGTLHALRIACKQLRYTAEFFRSCYAKRLNPLIRQATEFQDILGRHHDADVHIAYLTAFMTRLDRRSSRQRRIQADLEGIIAAERLAQQASYTRFQELWNPDAPPFIEVDFSLQPWPEEA